MSELILAVLFNVKGLAIAGAIFGVIGFGITVLIAGILRGGSINERDPDSNRAKYLLTQLVPKQMIFVAVCAAFSVIPSVDDLWKVRIGLIKLQLASPENIQKGAEVIERIGQKLECKYLGCAEERNK